LRLSLGGPNDGSLALAAGSASGLLVGDHTTVHAYAGPGLVGRILAYLPREDPPHNRPASLDGGRRPAGFRIERVTKTERYTTLEAAPIAGTATP
jgi:hypothetical protein